MSEPEKPAPIQWLVKRADGSLAAFVWSTGSEIAIELPIGGASITPLVAKGLSAALRDAAAYVERTEARELDSMMAKARDAVDRMTPDQLAHMRHAQRISFAAGNVALSWSPSAAPYLDKGDADALALAGALARKAAGPCPCAACVTAAAAELQP